MNWLDWLLIITLGFFALVFLCLSVYLMALVPFLSVVLFVLSAIFLAEFEILLLTKQLQRTVQQQKTIDKELKDISKIAYNSLDSVVTVMDDYNKLERRVNKKIRDLRSK